MSSKCEKIGEMVAEYVKLLLFPPQRFLLGITTVKIAIIEKRKARGGRWEGGNGRSRGLASSLFPSHRPPMPFFPSPQPPYDTKRPSRRKVIKLYYKSIQSTLSKTDTFGTGTKRPS